MLFVEGMIVGAALAFILIFFALIQEDKKRKL